MAKRGGFITVDKEPLERAIHWLQNNIKYAIVAQTSEAVGGVADQTVSDLRDAAPVGQWDHDNQAAGNDAPGKLRESFYSQLTSAGGTRMLFEVGTTMPTKLKFVQGGVGLYGPSHSPIVPRQKLALWWKGASHPTARVPGYEGKPFVQPVLDQNQPTVKPRLIQLVTPHLRAIFEGHI